MADAADVWWELRQLRDRGIVVEIVDGRLAFSTAAPPDARADALSLLTRHSAEVRAILEAEQSIDPNHLAFARHLAERGHGGG